MKNKAVILAILMAVAGSLIAVPVTSSAKTLFMNDTDIASVNVLLGQSTILSFPTKPSKVVLGNQNVFGVEYIENDLAISALHPQAKCNLVVYLPGRRFSFNLVASAKTGDEILLIRDATFKTSKKTKKPKTSRASKAFKTSKTAGAP